MRLRLIHSIVDWVGTGIWLTGWMWLGWCVLEPPATVAWRVFAMFLFVALLVGGFCLVAMAKEYGEG